ncbi:hypothetical protein [Vannielia litorea]|uniref:hypothetical protein n=1 Tax=Vannielia litorea TaxID=1217970 RepID=UPI001BD0AA8C|nr:hypothetical protein [Vannielia litorea]MBS8228060.1 hypothetical protein [Vannielia litorea]
MAITSASVRSRISAADWSDRDGEAVRIINAATSAELAKLDANAVLILYRAMFLGWTSAEDAHAIALLRSRCGFPAITSLPDEAVDAVSAATKPGNTIAHRFLTAGLVTRIYAAEGKRMSWFERNIMDGKTIGRGQLGQPAYDDVKSEYAAALTAWVERVGVSEHLEDGDVPYAVKWNSTFTKVEPHESYGPVIYLHSTEDFVVAAYLAILIQRATKPGRPDKDVLRIAVALYHGMRGMVVAAQKASGQDVLWAPIERELRAAGHDDAADYVLEVVP